LGDLLDAPARAVGRAVVHEDDLVGAAELGEGVAERLEERREVRFLVMEGHDDREIDRALERSGPRPGASRSRRAPRWTGPASGHALGTSDLRGGDSNPISGGQGAPSACRHNAVIMDATRPLERDRQGWLARAAQILRDRPLVAGCMLALLVVAAYAPALG